MADLRNFVITNLATASRSVARFKVEGQFIDEQGNVLPNGDFTGANAFTFPDDVTTKLSNAQQIDLRDHIIRYLVGLAANRL